MNNLRYMKVGILTFHFAHNYGAMLQAYALETFLNNIKCHTEIIDYRLPSIYRCHERLNFRQLYLRYRQESNVILSVLRTIKNYVKHRHRNLAWFRFDSFLNDVLIKSSRVFSIDEINKLSYDVIICGSDQIWNSSITKGLIPLYFCEGIKGKVKKIAYAASNGDCQIKISEWEQFSKLVRNFDAISIREDSLSSWLNSKGVYNLKVLDPIFLLDKEEWKKLCSDVQYTNYLLTYSFDENPSFFEKVRNLSKKLELKIICFLYKEHDNFDDDFIQVSDGGPREFLSLFNQASLVVTNSFHGTAFSILFQKQFYCDEPRNGKERIISLLQTLGLEKRLCTGELVDEGKIDYSIVNHRVQELRNRSIDFLTSSIRDIK